ncbi:peptide deformylase [Acetobacteraceae bacterium KSS8]|uniref:Peptide deformylase n=1 Tax=Endosaccharibacter trunci TaxID=2812733 RepID=A0ABT1W992_9PROT|nr:peptide deformylase [Acetobacteraceae bacterium KSS8]
MTQIPSAAVPADAGTRPAIEPIGILVAPHPVLRRKTRLVGPDDRAMLRDVLPRMFEAMYQAPGIGLAAPQVGIDLRFCIVDLHENDVREPIVLINPEIVAESEQLAAREEGCLSLPGQYAEVVRPEGVTVRFEDETGAAREIKADGLLATCFQHEIDHLDGILFVDHLSALKRNMIMRRLAKEMKAKG